MLQSMRHNDRHYYDIISTSFACWDAEKCVLPSRCVGVAGQVPIVGWSFPIQQDQDIAPRMLYWKTDIGVAVGNSRVTERRRWRSPYQTGKNEDIHAQPNKH